MINFLDIAILVLIGACVLIGVHRGFVGSLLRILSGVLKLLVATFLVKPFVKLVKLTNLDEQMFDKMVGRFAQMSDKFSVNLVGLEEPELSVFVEDALADAQIPKIFRGLFINVFSITPETIAAREYVTLAELMSVTVTNMILLSCSFLFLYLVLWIVIKLIGRWSKKASNGKTMFAKTNKWLGALFGLVEAVLICFVVFVVVALFDDFGFMYRVVAYINNSLIGRFLLKIAQALINSSFNLRQLLEDWVATK